MDELKDISLDPDKLARARGDLPLTKAAKAIGISKQRLWNYEHGLYPPPAEVLVRLCFLYKVRLESLTTASENFLKTMYIGS